MKQTSKRKRRDFHEPPEVCKLHGTYKDSCACTPLHPVFIELKELIFDVDECLALKVDQTNVPKM